MIQEITQYKTSDGKLFDNRGDAEQHERFAIFRQELRESLVLYTSLRSVELPVSDINSIANHLQSKFHISPKIKP